MTRFGAWLDATLSWVFGPDKSLPEETNEYIQEPVMKSVDLPQGGSITLYNWSEQPVRDAGNLIRTAPDGAVIWQATPISFGDPFVAFSWDGEKLIAWTFSCYMVAVDIDTGAVEIIAFTK